MKKTINLESFRTFKPANLKTGTSYTNIYGGVDVEVDQESQALDDSYSNDYSLHDDTSAFHDGCQYSDDSISADGSVSND